jgi:hypothetical protein
MSLGPGATLTSVGGGVDATGTKAEPTTDIGEAAGTGGTVLAVPSLVPKARWTTTSVFLLESCS